MREGIVCIEENEKKEEEMQSAVARRYIGWTGPERMTEKACKER